MTHMPLPAGADRLACAPGRISQCGGLAKLDRRGPGNWRYAPPGPATL